MTYINNLNISLIKDIVSIADQLSSEGLPLPIWIIDIICIIVLLSIIIGAINIIYRAYSSIKKYVRTRMYAEGDKKFLKLKNNFIENLAYRVDRLNKDDNWSELFYTNLDAEIEVDSSVDIDFGTLDSLMIWVKSFYYLIFKLIGFSSTSMIRENLVKAIFNSNSHAFLILGDPGSGKTISLRHLFFEKARVCLNSGDRNAGIPIYLNLKHLNVNPEKISPLEIRKWIIDWLILDQDRTINEFVTDYFDILIKNGEFFFIFDSFDEIPAVLDAHEDEEVIDKYAKALDDFIHSNPCKGLVSSRPYRAPSTFVGQRMTILQLSNRRIREAINKYLLEDKNKLADLIWNQLESREDLLFVARNPFYLALIVEYSRYNENLPEKQYDLFEHFVIRRADLDESRLGHFGLLPHDLIENASLLAFALYDRTPVSLEATSEEIFDIFHYHDPKNHNYVEVEIDWGKEKIVSLIDALCYSKLGRKSHDQAFSFVHRRFHEYFCARYITQYPDKAPISRISEDDRWREVLVLLCEVLQKENLDDIFNFIRKSFSFAAAYEDMNNLKTGEIVRFLKDGFRSRIMDVPNDIRLQCTQYIVQRFSSENLLDKKRATELISLVDDESIHNILESTLNSDSAWLRETALRSCNILAYIPDSLKKAVRNHLYSKYLNIDILKDFKSYRFIFSSPFRLHDLSTYLNILAISVVFQILFFMVLISSYYIYDIYSLAVLISGIIFILIIDASDFNLPISRSFWGKLYCGVLSGYVLIESINASKYYLNGLFIQVPFKISDNYILIYLISMMIFNIIMYAWVKDYLRYVLPQLSHPMPLMNIFIKMVIRSPLPLLHLVKYISMSIYKQFAKNPKAFVSSMIFTITYSSLIVILAYGLNKSFEILAKYNYSISKIYASEGLLRLLLILLLPALTSISISVIILMVILLIIYRFSMVIKDQANITRLLLVQQKRPTNATEAIALMDELRSDIGRKQYLQSLRKWLPTGDNPELFIAQTTKFKNRAIIDELYKVAEQWDDYLQRNRLK